MWGWAQGKVFLVVIEVNEVTQGMEQLMAKENTIENVKWVEEKKPKKLPELGREPWETITGQGGVSQVTPVLSKVQRLKFFITF